MGRDSASRPIGRRGVQYPSHLPVRYNSDKLSHSGERYFSVLEQVHVIGLFCRDSRFNRFAVLGMALGLPALAAAQATQTRISTETRDAAGRTQALVSVAVEASDAGRGALSGTVILKDGNRPLGSAVLETDGRARLTVDLLPGSHDLRAVYSGVRAHTASVSHPAVVSASAGTTPDFTVSANPAALTLTAGQSGTVTVSVTPVNSSGLAAPMFVTLACSGMPDQSSCSFTPQSVEIQPNASTAVSSILVVATQGAGTRGAIDRPGANSVSNPVAWAVLPGTLLLAGLAFSTRRRRWLSRLSLIALVGFVSLLGTTACAARYNYYNHGPPYNQPTPPGTYNVTFTAQSSNGVTATTHSAPFALTVK